MDNKQAIEHLRNISIYNNLAHWEENALDKAITSLEAWDKIRAEIEALEYLNIEDGSGGHDKYIEQYEVLKIIDKYRMESEE